MIMLPLTCIGIVLLILFGMIALILIVAVMFWVINKAIP